jgi:cell division protein FtsW (lipid II flippase)
MFPIAQMEFSLYIPMVLLLLGYVVLSILVGRARSSEDRPRAERLSNYAFLVVLVSAAYAVVLVLATVVSYPSRFYDMVIIIVVICAFFALLLFVFFVIAELIPDALRRGRDR